MNKIPVEFDYEGKHYKGHLSEVSGAAAKVWHLMIDNYYHGQLMYSEERGWSFHGNMGMMAVLADLFEGVVMLWYE